MKLEIMPLISNSTSSLIGNGTALGQNENSTCIFVASSSERISKLFVMSFILLGSFFGNIFIIIIVYRNRNLRNTINYFIVNMAWSDLVFPLILLPVRMTELVTDSKHWRVSGILGSIFCKMSYFASLVSLLVSTQSLVWIAVDRFVAVVYPMKLGLISAKIRTIAIVSTWISASLVNFPSLISSKLIVSDNDTACVETNMESFLFDDKDNEKYLWLQFSLFIITPVVVTTVLYTAIAISLKLQKKALAGTPSNAQRHALRKRRQAIIMAVTTLVLFYLCVTPQILVYFIPYWIPSCDIQRVLFFVTSFSTYLSSMVNPLICLSFVESYRRGLRNILCRCGRKRNSNVTSKCREINVMRMKTPHGESYRQSSKNTENSNEAFETVL